MRLDAVPAEREGIEFVVCAWCGKRFRVLAVHVRRMHGRDPADYPGPLACDDVRANALDRLRDRGGGDQWTRDQVLAWLRRFADDHDGRAPRQGELARLRNKQVGLRRKSRRPSHATLAKLFGSFAEAIAAAGLDHPQHKKGAAMSCKRGHALIDENVYWATDRHGHRYRQCRECMRMLGRRHDRKRRKATT